MLHFIEEKSKQRKKKQKYITKEVKEGQKRKKQKQNKITYPRTKSNTKQFPQSQPQWTPNQIEICR